LIAQHVREGNAAEENTSLGARTDAMAAASECQVLVATGRFGKTRYIPIGMEQLIAPSPTKGRPREFCVDMALAAALRVFWQHGYEGASMSELTAEMGITKPSLYAAFGNKEQLFHKALDLYEREKLEYMRTAGDAPTARGVAEKLLWGALEIQMSSCDPRGCLGVISTTACGAEAESIKAEVVKRRAGTLSVRPDAGHVGPGRLRRDLRADEAAGYHQPFGVADALSAGGFRPSLILSNPC
jgi:AcrR family transcriptional regulator